MGSGCEKKPKAKAIIIGGSIAGVSCAHALTLAGWDVVVLEKTCAPPTGSPTGAGLGLDPLSQKLIQSWLGDSDSLRTTTVPLTIDQVRCRYSSINELPLIFLLLECLFIFHETKRFLRFPLIEKGFIGKLMFMNFLNRTKQSMVRRSGKRLQETRTSISERRIGLISMAFSTIH